MRGKILEEKYELGRTIGQGGMGQVFEARHLGVGRTVAVKLLAKELAGKDTAKARFHREARAAGRINHDNVCEVLDLGVADDGTPFYTMPLLKGETLAELLDREGQLDLQRAYDIAFQLLDAMATAHSRGVIHRDLKPGNIFLTQVGDHADFVKILDFGITKFQGFDVEEEELSLTDKGAVMGTPHYMAPEQAKGSSDIDGRVDLYALGLILYRMLTGSRAIDGDSYNEILWNMWNAPIKPPRALRPELATEIENVITKAMARDREERYATAELFHAELEAALLQIQKRPGAIDGATLPTVPSTAPAPGSKEVPLTDEVIGPADRALLSDENSRGHRHASVLVGITLFLLVLLGVTLWWLSSGSGHRSGATQVETASSTPSKLDEAHLPSASIPATPDASQASKEVSDPRSVAITLVDLPEDAEATINGRTISLPTFDVPVSEVPLEVVLRAQGHSEKRFQVHALEDVVIPIHLIPLTPPRAKGPSKNPSSRRERAARKNHGKAPIRSFREMP